MEVKLTFPLVRKEIWEMGTAQNTYGRVLGVGKPAVFDVTDTPELPKKIRMLKDNLF